MTAAYLIFNFNSILVCEMSFSDRWGHPKLTRLLQSGKEFTAMFIASISQCGKFTALHKLILIVYY